VLRRCDARSTLKYIAWVVLLGFRVLWFVLLLASLIEPTTIATGSHCCNFSLVLTLGPTAVDYDWGHLVACCWVLTIRELKVGQVTHSRVIACPPLYYTASSIPLSPGAVHSQLGHMS